MVASSRFIYKRYVFRHSRRKILYIVDLQMILCYELPIRFPQDTEAPQNVALIMLFSLTDDEYNHSCAGSESNDTDDYPDPYVG